jgi:hypothetical protein
MDLPGKENLYQTYCANTFNNDKFANIYDPRNRFVNHRANEEKDIVEKQEASIAVPPVATISIPLTATAAAYYGEKGEAGSQTRTSSNPEGSQTNSGTVSSVGLGLNFSEKALKAYEDAKAKGKTEREAIAIAKNIDRNKAAQDTASSTRLGTTLGLGGLTGANVKRGGGITYNPRHYDEKMIKAMMYINPLWLGTIPETAEHFDNQKFGDHLRIDEIPIPINTLTSYDIDSNTLANIKADKYTGTIYNTNMIPKNCILDNSSNTSHYSVYPKYSDKCALYGLTSRAVANITNMIKEENGLEILGEKINDMLDNSEMKKKRYGYAGLEGIYINENILGLLQVLATKIQESRPDKKDIVDVVCSQKEVYKNILNGTEYGLIPIGWPILQTSGQVDEFGNLKPNASKLVQDDEFLSQILFLRGIIKSATDFEFDRKKDKTFFTPTVSDKYNNYFRENNEISIKKGSRRDTRGLSKDIDNIEKNWINNYDYNKIFNIENPPIKSILGAYLDDPSFQNFYLFFVTSNNVKEDSKDASKNLDTCDKQIQLMYDTRHFMEVIAKKDAKGVTGQCN